MKQVPTVGRIVIYNTTAKERETMKTNGCNEQVQLPAVVVAVWGENTINVKVIMDGSTPDLWRTSVGIANIEQENQEGKWHWPVIVPVGPTGTKPEYKENEEKKD